MAYFSYRPHIPAILFAAALSLVAPAVAAQTVPNVDFFIDLAGDEAREAMRVGTATSGIHVDGVPLKLGVAEDRNAEGWHMVAGARGRYGLQFGQGLELIARGSATRTTFIDDPIQDRAGATGATELRLTRGLWQFGVTPGVAVTRWSTGNMHRDGTVEGRLARPITESLGIAATARYRWRIADGTEMFHSEATGGRIGFTYRLPAAKFELAYAARQESWSATSGYGGPEATVARGPLLSAALPLDREFKLNAGYSFTETTSWGSGGLASETVDRLHQLNLGLMWDVGGAFSDVALSLKYRFEHASAAARASEARHFGTVNVALGF